MRYYRRNTMNLIAVIFSIFAVFGLLVAVPGLYGSPMANFSLVLGAFFIAMPLVNVLLQNMAVKQVADPEKYFFSLRFDESKLYESLILGSAIVLLYFIPATDLRVYGWPVAMGISLVWSVVGAATVLISSKLTHIDFQSDTILVKGLNFFKAAGLTQKTTTGLGVYTYEEFECFALEETHLKLLLKDGKGQVSVLLPKDKSVQVTQFLTAKGIQRSGQKKA